MNTRHRRPHSVRTRTAVCAAAVAGFLVGAGGLTAAQIGVEGTAGTSAAVDVDTIAPDTTVSSTSIPDASSTSVPASPSSTSASSTTVSSTSIPDTSASSTSIPDTSPSSTSIPDTSASSISIPDVSSTSVPDTSSSVPTSTDVALPGPFTRTYSSAGGSVTVSWSGTALDLQAVDPVPGFASQIEEHASDRIRVDFEGEHDTRIEVRLNDGRIRVRID